MKLKLKNKIEGESFIEIKDFTWYVFKANVIIILLEFVALILIGLIFSFF